VRREEKKTKPSTWLVFPSGHLLNSHTVYGRSLRSLEESSQSKVFSGSFDSVTVLKREKLEFCTSHREKSLRIPQALS
jgi:hypothetical protein